MTLSANKRPRPHPDFQRKSIAVVLVEIIFIDVLTVFSTAGFMHARHCAAAIRVHVLDQIERTRGPLRLNRAQARSYRYLALSGDIDRYAAETA